ncbi:MAG: hypothetical protein OSA84_13130 [Akkermansiaceae bacterium]|nr:hypothetical protein [Akkermansiaceae bacterium]
MSAEQSQEGVSKHDGEFVEISISTLSGSFPTAGFNRIPAHQKLEVELATARHQLEIKDVSGWVATVREQAGTRELDVDKSYLENGLAGRIALHWGPRELVEISVETPEGSFPTEGFNRVSADQKIELELATAKHQLELKDTHGWVATAEGPAGKRELDIDKTYRENGLSGRVHIHWGPAHSVEVSIATTAGFFPTEGFNRVPADQKVEVELGKAKHELKIKDTAGWIATVIGPAGKRELDPSKSYTENNLSGKVEIDWGPKEGGGG